MSATPRGQLLADVLFEDDGVAPGDDGEGVHVTDGEDVLVLI